MGPQRDSSKYGDLPKGGWHLLWVAGEEELCPRVRPTLISFGRDHKASTAKTWALYDARKAGILSECEALRFLTGGVVSLNPRLNAHIPIGMAQHKVAGTCCRGGGRGRAVSP
jgi:hypothetical protein